MALQLSQSTKAKSSDTWESFSFNIAFPAIHPYQLNKQNASSNPGLRPHCPRWASGLPIPSHPSSRRRQAREHHLRQDSILLFPTTNRSHPSRTRRTQEPRLRSPQEGKCRKRHQDPTTTCTSPKEARGLLHPIQGRTSKFLTLPQNHLLTTLTPYWLIIIISSLIIISRNKLDTQLQLQLLNHPTDSQSEPHPPNTDSKCLSSYPSSALLFPSTNDLLWSPTTTQQSILFFLLLILQIIPSLLLSYCYYITSNLNPFLRLTVSLTKCFTVSQSVHF